MNPDSGRGSWVAGIGPWAGIGTNPAGIMLGGGLAASLGGFSLLAAVAVGLAALVLLGILHGDIGRRLGREALSVMLGPLGSAAAPVAAVGLAVMMIGWLGVNAGVAGAAAAQLLNIPEVAGVVIFMLVMSAVAWFGLRALSWFAASAALATIAVAGWGMWLAREAPTSATPAAGAEVGVLGAAALVVGFGAAFALRSPDFTRSAGSRGQVVGNALLGLCLPLLAFLAAGIALQRASGEWNLADVLVSLGSGSLAYLLLAIGFSGAVLTNLYSGALAVRLLGGGRYHPALAVTALAGGALAAAGIADRLLDFLGLIAVAAVSLLILSIAHHLLGRETRPGRDARGIIAWALGAAVGAATTTVAPDLALPLAAAVSLTVYLLPRGEGEGDPTAPARS